jgi:amino acid transporter
MESHELRRELNLRDVVLTQIVYVVGITWVGTAAKLGRSQIVFWLAAMLLFYLPQAAVVIHLTTRMPLEGGLYQWAKIGLGDAAGYMVAWNLWMYAVLLISTVGLIVTTNLSYAFVGLTDIAANKYLIAGSNCAIIGVLAVLAIVGLRTSKWVHNVGSISLMIAFAVLIALPFIHSARGTIPTYHPLAIAAPAFTLLSLNIFGKMAVGALSGFEYVAVLAGECKDPARTIGGGTLIAAPIIAVMFIFGTSSVLALVPDNHIDLIGPIPQSLRNGLGVTGLGAIAAPIAIVLLTGRTFGNMSIVFTATSRLPMVAGWDRLLPEWFTRLSPKARTPVNSIIFVAVVSMVFSLWGIAGVGAQEAYQILENCAGIFYGITYLVLFAVPLAGLAAVGGNVPLWLRLACVAGLGTTILYTALSIFPIIEVTSWVSFGLKVGGVIVIANLIGYALYVVGRTVERPTPIREEPA